MLQHMDEPDLDDSIFVIEPTSPNKSDGHEDVIFLAISLIESNTDVSQAFFYIIVI